MFSDYIISPSRPLRITLHLVFWLTILLFYTFFYGRLSNNIYYAFNHLILTFPLYIAATYITLYFIIPRYLLKKNYKGFIVSVIYLILGVAYIEILSTIYLLVFPANAISFTGTERIDVTSLDIYLRLIGIFVVVFLSSSTKLLKHWYAMQRKSQLLIKEKLEAELNFLKSQVHPHFLFNTLNNLYALTLKKSDKSPDVVLKLADILDYMLYHSDKNFVAVEKEIHLIQNYIELEKLRHGEKLKLEFKIGGDAEGKYISPMLLFPLVENCFKHGVGSSNKESRVYLKLNVYKNSLEFHANNTKHLKQNKNGGLGLQNLKKRLDLLYKNEHELEIDDIESEFTVRLKIPLKSLEELTENENEMHDN